jgi:hypothetical protein
MSAHADWTKLPSHFAIPQALDCAVTKEAKFKAAQETTKAVPPAVQDTIMASAPLKHNSAAGASDKTGTVEYQDFSVTDNSRGTFSHNSLSGSDPYYSIDTHDINTNPEGIYEISHGLLILGDCTSCATISSPSTQFTII